MKSLIAYGITVLLALLPMLYFSGCTILGAISGSRFSEDAKILAGWEIHEVDAGEEVEILLNDGSVHIGLYQGNQLEPFDSYVKRYKSWYRQLEDTTGIPMPGDTIEVLLSDGTAIKNALGGFDEQVLYLKRDKAVDDGIAMTNITMLSSRGIKACSGDELWQRLDQSRAPMRTALALSRLSRHQPYKYLDPNDVARVKISGKNYTSLGLMTGLVIDGLIVVAVLDWWNNMEWEWECVSNCHGSSSCPFIYSFVDGAFAFEGEALGGAFFEASQRTDWLRLKHLAESSGSYRVKLANGRPETDYIDEVKLVVLDHPPETQVFASQHGSFYLLGPPHTLISATDYAGANVASLLSDSDDAYWLSNPFRPDPSSDDVRDGVVLDYAIDPNAASAVLTMRIKNTPWFSEIGQTMMELPGEDWEAFYEQLNTSEEARARLETMLEREMLLQVEVWDGMQWRSTGHMQITGPENWRAEAITVPLAGLPTPTLRVRLSSTAGFWMIDSVQMHDEVQALVHQETLDPSQVITQEGSDARADVLAADGVSYAMPSSDYWLDVRFDRVPERPDMQRSYFLQTHGYYSPQLWPQEPANLAVLDELLTTPGAVGRFALGRLQTDLAAALEDH